MAAKEILHTNIARDQIAKGLNTLADAVKVTLGPRGRNVLLERPWGAPLITKDGVTVAEEIELENRFSNLGVQMVKEVASKTSEVSGDGTTTATVLAQAMFSEGVKLVTAGIDPMEIKRGIEIAVEAVVAELKVQSKPTKDRSEIAQVGTISSNGDEAIGALIAEAMEKVGREGIVTIEEAKSMETTLTFTHGMRFDRGYLSPYFVTDTGRMEVVLTDAFVLLVGKRLSSVRDLIPLLEQVSGEKKPLLVVADDVEGEALATLVVNKLRGSLQICAVRAPEFGDLRKEMLQDIAVLCGAQVLTDELGLQLEKVTLKELGRVKTIRIDKDTTTLIEGGGEQDVIAGRMRQIRSQIEEAPSEYDREKLRARLAKMAGGVAVINIGAITETEMKEKKARVEDALHATRAAVAEGIVPGGGVALLRTIPTLDRLVLTGDQQYGVNIVRRAIEQPLRQIAENAGVEGAVVVNEVCAGKGAFGYNAATNQYEDLVLAGIIDPTMVVRVALQNAASVASLMLTAEILIAERSARPSGIGPRP